jgi:prevent-host-death family protein
MSTLAADGTIGVYDLKNSLSAVLEEVAAGREITVTRHGHPIARIAPVVRSSVDDRAAAVADLQALSQRVRPMPAGMTLRDLIDNGRRL